MAGLLKAVLAVSISLTFEFLAYGQILINEINNSHIGSVSILSISNDDRFLLSVGSDKRVNYWDLNKLIKIKSFKDNEGFNNAFFSNNSRYFVTSANSNKIILWDNNSHKPKTAFSVKGEDITCVVFSPQTDNFYGACESGKIFRWDNSGKVVRVIHAFKGPIVNLAVSNSGKYIAAVPEKGNVTIWDLETYSINSQLPIKEKNANTIHFSPDNLHLVITEADGQLNLFYGERFTEVKVIEFHQEITSLDFSHYGSLLIIGLTNGDIFKVNSEGLEKSDLILSAHNGAVSALRINYQANVLYSGGADGYIRIWDLNQLALIKSERYIHKELANPAMLSQSINANQISSNNKYEFGDYYALIIGVNEYSDPDIQDLDEPVSDASVLYNMLTEKYTFEPDKIIKLNNPTREEILLSLENLNKQVTSRDNLLIFFAGHGTWDASIKTGYWLPSDANLNSTANWFRNSTLRDYVAGINTKHTLIIADACFSGAIFKTRSISQAEESTNQYGAEKLHKQPSRKAMTSGTLKTVPDKSVFMMYLVKRLEENEFKYFSSQDLFASFRIAVLNNSPNIPQFGEVMNAGDEGGDFIFIKKE